MTNNIIPLLLELYINVYFNKRSQMYTFTNTLITVQNYRKNVRNCVNTLYERSIITRYIFEHSITNKGSLSFIILITKIFFGVLYSFVVSKFIFRKIDHISKELHESIPKCCYYGY